jgi:hypothetical protein
VCCSLKPLRTRCSINDQGRNGSTLVSRTSEVQRMSHPTSLVSLTDFSPDYTTCDMSYDWNELKCIDRSSSIGASVFTPTALHSIAQGRPRYAAHPGITCGFGAQTPTWFYNRSYRRSSMIDRQSNEFNPVGVVAELIIGQDPGCAATPRPWAVESNAFGVNRGERNLTDCSTQSQA